MASFFQTALTGPQTDRDPNTKFLIVWNAALQGRQLTLYWYQTLVITVGCVFFVLGCANLIVQYIRQKRRLKESLLPPSLKRLFRLPKFARRHDDTLSQICEDTPTSTGLVPPATRSSPPKLSAIKSFCVSEHEIPVQRFQSNFDLHIVRLTGERVAESSTRSDETPKHDAHVSTESTVSVSRSSTRESLESTTQGTVKDSVHPSRISAEEQAVSQTKTLFYGTLKATDQFTGKSISDKASLINNLRLKQGLDGIVISYGTEDTAMDINALLEALNSRHVSTILMGDPDLEVINSVHFGLIDGLVIRDASILPNGQRRDFFRAVQVRECVARCKRQMKTRPDFFLGFLEIWTVRPSAATLRRAFKLADFFGAVMQAQAATQHNSRIEMCLSGFDWLKRPEIIKLQKSWTQNPAINLCALSESEETQLNIQKLSQVLGPAENFLTLKPLPPDLSSIQNEKLESVESPHYVSDAPRRNSIWDQASCGALLCERGCFNVRDHMMQEHYDRILQTQRGLKELQMLHLYDDMEILSLSNTLKTALWQSDHPKLLQGLLDQLANGQVRVYKGLDSGFSLPDDGGHMLGVSDSYTEDSRQIVDVFISLKNSLDAATIWHVFLAHHGIGRLQRYEEELQFFPGTRLPKSIQQELDQCTEAELLSLIEQIRLSEADHSFNQAIIQTCTALLIEGSSRCTWTNLHSQACLDESLTIRTLLKMRLEQFAKQGARRLPKLEKLVEFSELLERKLQDALFTSDRFTLNQISTPLVDAYSAIGITKPAEPRLDLYGLMYFCALRRFAFEDVYLETTDRCPLFLQQHDQAGVFSELWVLGSQCEIYFGVLPRMLGEVIYDKYQIYLTEHPPPPDSWDGKEVFTAYTNAEARIKLEGHGVMTGSGSPVELPGQAPGYKVDEPRSTRRILEATSQFGALSIFCFPAVIDVVLLSFLGRGFYLTAYMDTHVVEMANYAILTALVMTGGITGWVGSTGGFYLFSVSGMFLSWSVQRTKLFSLPSTTWHILLYNVSLQRSC